MLLFLLSCALSEVAPLELRWFSEDVQCVNREVVWEVPEGIVTLSVRQTLAQGDATYTFFGGTPTAVDGWVVFDCSNDVSFLYAIAM
jgi:hypothetical protein